MMKRVWKISEAAHTELFFHRCFPKPCTVTTHPCNRLKNFPQSSVQEICTQIGSPPSTAFSDIYLLFADKWTHAQKRTRDELCAKVAQLKEELIRRDDNGGGINQVLEDSGRSLFMIHRDGSAMVELLAQLGASSPELAIKVMEWRRKEDTTNTMTSEEYAKCISIAGRVRNLDLAVELFTEAASKRLKTTSTYNALMGAYMFNGLYEKCQSLFQDLKRESHCSPTIITYNILISIFGRSMLIDHMEATFKEVEDSRITPGLGTYNSVIAGYLTAWMWGSMEKTYMIMKAGKVKPNLSTHLLMLRGYAHSGMLEKMEEVYHLVKDHVDKSEISLIRAMICAYCRSSDVNRVEKIENLLRLIPESGYRPWLNILMIVVYAKEDLVQGMESLIDLAFERNTAVRTSGIMRCIIGSYFRNSSVEKLANFVRRAEEAGWKICRSLYHSKMVMYSLQNRLDEMESVLSEMDRFNLECTKRTFWILYKAYSVWGEKHKVQCVLGLMCKRGYGIPGFE